LAPFYRQAKIVMDGKVQLLLALVNSGYLWILWITFMTLPEEARRFVTVGVGTVYPIIASTVSIANSSSSVSTDHEETFWLTYWCCYSILFVAMDYLETFIGFIPGFYSICLCATVYL
jgi:TB2/DP1, HVA22 family